MNISTSIEDKVAKASIVKAGSKTVSLYLTFSHLGESTAKNTVIELLYKDLILSGTTKKSREDIQYDLKKIGAEINVGLDNGRITISMSSLAEKQKELLNIFALLINDSTFANKEITRAKTTLINRLELAKENSRFLADASLCNKFYSKKSKKYTYLQDELKNQVKSITRNDLLNYHKDLISNHFSVTVSGNEKTVKTGHIEILKIIDNKNNSKLILDEDKTIPTKKREVVLTEVKSKQNIEIAIGGQLPLTKKDSLLPAFIFGLAVLGKWGGFSGRLMSTVREKEGLTYGIYAKVENIGVDASGYWRIMTFFSPKDVKQGITSTLREIKSIEEKGITKSEFLRFKEIIKTSNTLVFDSLSKVTALVHNQITNGVTWEAYQKFHESLLNCSMKEVNQALKQNIKSDKLVISAAGPIEKVKKDILTFKN